MTSTEAAPASERGLACGNCGAPMRHLSLSGHYGRPVELDLCEPCHLLWFDSLEASRLTGSSMLKLIGSMAEAQAQPHHALQPRIRCPRCGGAVKTVHNRSRFGSAEQLECVRGHGAWSSFGQWLAERGLVRPLAPADRAALQADPRVAWCCVNCGAPLPSSRANECEHCGTLAGVLDLARLASALDPEGATASLDVHRSARQQHTFVCHACGHSAPGQQGLRCPRCGATQISTDLRDVHARIAHLHAPLADHERSPAPHVRQRRMEALAGDLERRRETVRELERSVRPGAEHEDDRTAGRPPLLDVLLGRRGVPWTWRAGFWGAVALLVYWWTGGFGG